MWYVSIHHQVHSGATHVYIYIYIDVYIIYIHIYIYIWYVNGNMQAGEWYQLVLVAMGMINFLSSAGHAHAPQTDGMWPWGSSCNGVTVMAQVHTAAIAHIGSPWLRSDLVKSQDSCDSAAHLVIPCAPRAVHFFFFAGTGHTQTQTQKKNKKRFRGKPDVPNRKSHQFHAFGWAQW